jgi:hypothetical protein
MPTDSPNAELINIVTFMQVLNAAHQLHDIKYQTTLSRIRHRRSYKRAQEGLRKHYEFIGSELDRLKAETPIA